MSVTRRQWLKGSVFAGLATSLCDYQEYKGDIRQTGGWFDRPIVFRDGKLTVPTAPGFGMVAAPDLVKDGKVIG